MTRSDQTRLVAVVPAAGVGQRMASTIPKQYLELAGACVLEHTLQSLLCCTSIEQVVVGIAATDIWFPSLALSCDPRVLTAPGGENRSDTVLNCLEQLANSDPDTWVLVHDAVRPCLSSDLLEALIAQVCETGAGGLLALPVYDTLKRASANRRVSETVDRDGMWMAQTPQMFRLGDLQRALTSAAAQCELITDEASAMELVGAQPLLVESSADNLKITRPADLDRAERILREREIGV